MPLIKSQIEVVQDKIPERLLTWNLDTHVVDFLLIDFRIPDA